MPNRSEDGVFDILAKLGHVRKTDKGASVGIAVGLKQIDIKDAIANLAESRLSITLKVTDPESNTPDMYVEPYSGVGEFGTIGGLNDEGFTGTLNINCENKVVKDLLDFDSRHIRFIFKRDGVKGQDPAGEAEINPDDPNQMSFEDDATDSWMDATLDDLGILGKPAEVLASHSLTTLGAISAYLAKDNALTDIHGIGQAAAQKIEAAMQDYFEAHPQPSPSEHAGAENTDEAAA